MTTFFLPADEEVHTSIEGHEELVRALTARDPVLSDRSIRHDPEEGTSARIKNVWSFWSTVHRPDSVSAEHVADPHNA
jgi:hypothetical protein